MHFKTQAPVLVFSVTALSLLTGACATKKHVREAIAPVQQQVNDLDKKTQENKTAIGDLDRNVARVDEKAMEADKKAAAAAAAADRANQAAGQAQQAANGANSLAQQAMNRAGQLEQRVANLDNYKLVTTEKVYFPVNRYSLSKEDKEKLDQVAQNLHGMSNYIVEIEGFTDTTGSKALNLELSRRRAEAVVRYLTVEHDVPLRKIHDIGVGEDFPNAVNRTRAERKENRRVDVRVYSLEEQGKALTSSTSNP
jgi:outer membrane protein OmpA-like peptidoglycan-associated protein